MNKLTIGTDPVKRCAGCKVSLRALDRYVDVYVPASTGTLEETFKTLHFCIKCWRSFGGKEKP